MAKRSKLASSLALLLALSILAGGVAALGAPGSEAAYGPIIGEIRALESNRDPKCHATASRLEDFMYGTPLTDDARFAKFDLQKALIAAIWADASNHARRRGAAEISLDDVTAGGAHVPLLKRDGTGGVVVQPAAGGAIELAANDLRQYSSVAYALRALLAVQQEDLANPDSAPLPLGSAAVEGIKEIVDVGTLAVLQLADRTARLGDAREVDAALLRRSWSAVFPAPPAAAAAAAGANIDFSLLRDIVAQKVASYSAYNEVSSQIFVRNLQVYFARRPWPEAADAAKELRALYTETMVAFATDLIVGSEKVARSAGHNAIRPADVAQFAQSFLPHEVNQYEDVTFFPRLPAADRVVIESYDMDAFRDSGLHWRYLEWAIDAPGFAATLGPDPFAAEILAENVSQFGVLLFRQMGLEAIAAGEPRLRPDDVGLAMRRIQAKVSAHAQAAPDHPADDSIASSGLTSSPADGAAYFTDVTRAAGIAFEHRSSDWLSRLMRSYLKAGEGVGNLTIPPAFGGAGVAADDVDGDGDADILLLSGAGNALFRNDGHGTFTDVTKAAGLDWRRPDGTPGEPRQPLIADFDNDGARDILITYVADDHRLYRNRGDGTFVDVTAQSGLGGAGSVGGPATTFDYDGDGLLDVYIGNFGDYPHNVLPTLARRNRNGLPNQLFHNRGGMRFEDVSAASGAADSGWTQALSHTDFDGDGKQDLIVGNDFGVNAYYRNLGGGRFEDVAAQLGTDKPSYSMNVGLADLNRDGFPDIYISNIVTMNKDEKYVEPNADTAMKFNPRKLANMRVVEANDLFLSQVEDGHLQRYELSDRVGRGRSSTGWAWDADFFDFDNDGDDDLYCLNGMNEYAVYSSENPYYTDPLENKRQNVVIPVSSRESNVFFVNQDGKLNNDSERSGVDLLGNSRSAAYLDFDGDGDLDIVVNDYHGAAVLYRNNSERLGRNWLAVQLIGDAEHGVNRDAIGARLILDTPGGTRVWREINGSIGYLSVHPKEQHFGLGDASTASVTVHWPNGEVRSFGPLEANRVYRIRQGAEQAEIDRNGAVGAATIAGESQASE